MLVETVALVVTGSGLLVDTEALEVTGSCLTVVTDSAALVTFSDA